MIESFQRVLFLGAHPDDEMGCAGLLYRLVQAGSEVDGITFSQCLDVNGIEITTEYVAALQTLGIPDRLGQFRLLDYPNRRLPEHRQDILDILDEYRSKYDLVLCPSLDAHQDHSVITTEAKRTFKDTTLLGYELPLNTIGAASMTCYISLNDQVMRIKLAHAATYRSQEHKPYMQPDYITGLARVRGVQSGNRWAEAYEAIRLVM